MVVDDNPFHRELLEVFLETMGFSIVWTMGTSEEARQQYRDAVPKPSIVLIDQVIGQEDGIRLVREMMAEYPTMRAIVLGQDAEVEGECYKAGAVGFVRKPFSLSEVGRAVNKVMRPGVVS
jgi:DNA-binding NarL/FixJ family response regulator